MEKNGGAYCHGFLPSPVLGSPSIRFRLTLSPMRIVLATGIYPPQIGGPATYVEKLAEQLVKHAKSVTVVTYDQGDRGQRTEDRGQDGTAWNIVYVSKKGGPLLRWMRYAKVLREVGKDADIVYAFSSISCGVPLFLSHLKGPKRILRLGGDFRWERYTDGGGVSSLRDWYASRTWFHGAMNGLLRTFDHLVFSTAFQQELYERSYTRLPLHSVIENALPAGTPMPHEKHDVFRLLYLGRFVGFKNIPALLEAVRDMPSVRLTLAGDGPLSEALHYQIGDFPREARDRIAFHPPVHGVDKQRLFADHDLLVLPSFTDISPNTALEARSVGLPVLLTEETGLSTMLAEGAMLRPLRTPQNIERAIEAAIDTYPQLAARASAPLPVRTWETICEEHLGLFRSLL